MLTTECTLIEENDTPAEAWFFAISRALAKGDESLPFFVKNFKT
jgi:hypothetical protein